MQTASTINPSAFVAMFPVTVPVADTDRTVKRNPNQRGAACMTSALANVDGHRVAATPQALLQFVQQQWSRLLAQGRLEIVLHADNCDGNRVPPLHGELFIGDQFRRNDTLYIDVVLKLHAEADAPESMPSVLVFERQTARLVQQEFNGLPENCGFSENSGLRFIAVAN